MAPVECDKMKALKDLLDLKAMPAYLPEMVC